MISKSYIKASMNIYSCNINKNTECNKKNCISNNGPCKKTTEFKYAKRTPSNYIKRLINIMRGR